MPEYDLRFAAKLAEVADKVDEDDPWAYDARRVTVYLSRLSAEITLKALLEKAGFPVSHIKSRNHNLKHLLNDVSSCEVLEEVTKGKTLWVPASKVRTVCLDLGFMQLPIDTIICAEEKGTSRYPNEIRYGSNVVDFDPSFVSGMAISLAKWAEENFNYIRRPKNVQP
jgi:hypothetical protein